MRRFYVALAAVTVVGVGAVVYGSRARGGGLPAATGVVQPAADGFRGYTLGSDSAPVEVVEYGDFECPACARFATIQMPAIRRQLIESRKVRWRYRDLPLTGVHQWARLAAHAAHCAGEQGRFWEMHDRLFADHGWAQKRPDPTALFRGFAQAVGLDGRAYAECMESGRYLGRIEASRLEAEGLRVTSTPTFYLQGRRFDQQATSDAFKAAVDSILTADRAR